MYVCLWRVPVCSEGAEKEIITFNDYPASCRCICLTIPYSPLGHSGCHGPLGITVLEGASELSFFLTLWSFQSPWSTAEVMLAFFYPPLVLLRACVTPCLCDGQDLTKFLFSFSWWLFYISTLYPLGSHLQLCGNLDPFVENPISTSRAANASLPFFLLAAG